MTTDISADHERQFKRASWNAHYLLTRTALASMRNGSFDEEVQVANLDDFVHAARKELPQVMSRYLALLAEKTGSAPAESALPDFRTERDLIEALRLNPRQPVHYVTVKSPDENPHNADHDPSRDGPPGASYIEIAPGDRMTVLDVLGTYSDEPDWGMDQGVFGIKGYGLGKPPIGSASGKSSQASFHMAFFHEMPLVVKLAPSVEKTFLDARVRVFIALARLAWDTGAEYWGWRFVAWAAHYLQDLTQPYHAKLLPFPLWGLFKLFLRHPRPRTFVDRNKYLLMNRHIMCEAVVHLWLNEAVKKRLEHPFLIALKGRGECAEGTLNQVLRESAKIAAKRAFQVNRGMEKLMVEPLLDDPTYFVLDEPPYPIVQKVADACARRPEEARKWIEVLSACLAQTGKVTRYIIREAGR